jgi:hypothetical protein
MRHARGPLLLRARAVLHMFTQNEACVRTM